MADSQNQSNEPKEVNLSESSELPKETVTEATKQPKQLKDLTPEEQADLARRRKAFKEVAELFFDLDTYSAESQSIELSSEIESDFSDMQSKIKITDLPESTMEIGKKVHAIVGDVSVQEVVAMLIAVSNAIRAHRYEKTKELKVSELGIKFL